jgi:predicted RNA-binding Zn-ribbon protein involved in translation (DUF1610 family)
MSFLGKLGKGVSKAAEQAKFEADKMMKTNKLSSELGELARQAAQINTGIGAKVIELQAAGKIHIPELDDLIAQLKNLDSQVAAKKAELEAVKVSHYEEAVVAAAPVAATRTVEVAPEAPAQEVKCPNCGAAVSPGTKFCPSCGQKL